MIASYYDGVRLPVQALSLPLRRTRVPNETIGHKKHANDKCRNIADLRRFPWDIRYREEGLVLGG